MDFYFGSLRQCFIFGQKNVQFCYPKIAALLYNINPDYFSSLNLNANELIILNSFGKLILFKRKSMWKSEYNINDDNKQWKTRKQS